MFCKQNAKDRKHLPKSWVLTAIILIAVFAIFPTKYGRQRQHLKDIEIQAEAQWFDHNPQAREWWHHAIRTSKTP